jgi:hypothetical protein
MSNETKYSNDRSAALSRARELPQAKRGLALSVASEAQKGGPAERNPDPYNSSGSFDRTKNWARIGKR